MVDCDTTSWRLGSSTGDGRPAALLRYAPGVAPAKAGEADLGLGGAMADGEYREDPSTVAQGDEFYSPACNTSAHVFVDYTTCEAYPEGIPLYILTGLSHHMTEQEGDHGLQYVYAQSLGPKPSWAP
jgi:hypothetical protein